MGKFMRKCSKGIGEVAVMEISSSNSQVGVRTRARTMAEAETKRKCSSDHFNLASSCFQRRKVASPALSSNSCSKPNSDDGSSELVNKSLRSGVDLEEFEKSANIERRETELHSESNDMESTGRVSSEVNSRHRTSAVKMPTDSEIEDFFSAAEKHDKKRFAEKYNYDIEKDLPLQGRYEWSPVKQ